MHTAFFGVKIVILVLWEEFVDIIVPIFCGCSRPLSQVQPAPPLNAPPLPGWSCDCHTLALVSVYGKTNCTCHLCFNFCIYSNFNPM